MRQIGIKVTLLPGEQKQVITKTRARQHQLAMLYWGTDYFDPNSNCQAFCDNPDDSDHSKLKILAWRSHFVDKELTSESTGACANWTPPSASRCTTRSSSNSGIVHRSPCCCSERGRGLGKGMSGFKSGRCPTTRTIRRLPKRERSAPDAGEQFCQRPSHAVRSDPGHLPDRPGDADRPGDRHRRRSRPARRDRRACATSSASTGRCSCSSASIWSTCCTAISAFAS